VSSGEWIISESATTRVRNMLRSSLQLKSKLRVFVDRWTSETSNEIAPEELLKPLIVPLESRHDFLTWPTEKKIPSSVRSNCHLLDEFWNPDDLVDEKAFLAGAVPYKIFVGDLPNEFRRIDEKFAAQMGFPETPALLEHLLAF